MPISVLVPRFLAVIPALVGVTFLSALALSNRRWPRSSHFYVYSLAALCALTLASTFWAINPGASFERALKIVPLIMGGLALHTLCTALKRDHKAQTFFLAVLPIATGTAGLLCLADILSAGALYGFLRGHMPGDENVFNPSNLNRAVVALTLLCPFAFYAITKSNLSARLKAAQTAVLALIMVCILVLTQSQSAQMAAILMLFMAFIYPLKRTKALWGLVALIMTGTLIAPWAVQYLYQETATSLKTAPWFTDAYAADRLEIWDFVARKALERPFLGYGLEATRYMTFDSPQIFRHSNTVLHPHNAVLQIWIEFGAIGVAAFCIWLFAFFKKISAISEIADKRFAVTCFCGVLIISCTAYGVWQGWWLGLLILNVALCNLLLQAQNATDKKAA